MARVLLVDDEDIWLKPIRRALPGHEVDQAHSYEEALELLGGDIAYDVAIVDLNLLGSDKAVKNDRLGGELLKLMKNQYPSVRRIALTGEPPTAVAAIFNKYDVDDLLLKENFDLSVVRDVVDAALKQIPRDVPDKFRVEKLELRGHLHSWRDPILLRLAQDAKKPQSDVRDAELLGKRADDSRKKLEALKSRQQNLETESAKLASLISNIHSDEDLAHARQEFSRLQAVYGT